MTRLILALALACLAVSARAQGTFPANPVGVANGVLKADGSGYVAWQAGSSVAPPVATAPIAAQKSSALESGHVFKASAGILYSLMVTTTTAAGYVMVLDAASVPSSGSTVAPLYWWPVGANSATGAPWNAPVATTNGVVVLFSTTGPFTYTASATAFFAAQVP